MIWSTNNNPTNPFSTRSMTDQYLTNPSLRSQRDRIHQQSSNYGSTSNELSDGPDTPDSRALETRLIEIERRHRNESICTKLFSSCCGKK